MSVITEVSALRRDRRARLAPQLLLVCAGAVLLNLAMKALEDHLHGAAEPATPVGRAAGAWLAWILGDTNEAQFYKAWLAGVGMLIFAAGAHAAAVRRWRGRGFDIAYGTGLWPWMLLSAGAGLLLSNLIWGWTLSAGPDGWQPTFVPFVSVPPAMVLIYGRGWRVALTAAGLGAVLTTPVSILVLKYFCTPLELPAVIANVTGMWVGALLAFALARALPWMPTPPAPPAEDPPRTAVPEPLAPEPRAAAAGPETRPAPEPAAPRGWLPRRALADFTEAQFYGNEWASLGLLGGALLAWLLNTLGPAYGSGVFPDVLTAQILTAALGAWLHAERWRRHGWYPTFVPVVSLAPAAVIVMEGGWAVIVLSAAAGAIIGPPLARAIAVRLPGDFHPFIGSVMSMTAITLAGIPVLKALGEAGLA